LIVYVYRIRYIKEYPLVCSIHSSTLNACGTNDEQVMRKTSVLEANIETHGGFFWLSCLLWLSLRENIIKC
jgi:hypothetical protein